MSDQRRQGPVRLELAADAFQKPHAVRLASAPLTFLGAFPLAQK